MSIYNISPWISCCFAFFLTLSFMLLCLCMYVSVAILCKRYSQHKCTSLVVCEWNGSQIHATVHSWLKVCLRTNTVHLHTYSFFVTFIDTCIKLYIQTGCVLYVFYCNSCTQASILLPQLVIDGCRNTFNPVFAYEYLCSTKNKCNSHISTGEIFKQHQSCHSYTLCTNVLFLARVFNYSLVIRYTVLMLHLNHHQMLGGYSVN